MKSKIKKYVPKNSSDNENPAYLFSLISNALLGGIVRGEIDAVELAKKELSERGYNDRGNWVGFNQK